MVRDRLQAGEHLHLTQHQDVTDAFLAGNREPLWEPGSKRERKAQVFPDQFTNWFGMTLATNGRAAALLFPRIDPITTPVLVDGERTLHEADFMSGADTRTATPTTSASPTASTAAAATRPAQTSPATSPRSRTTMSSSATTRTSTPTSSPNSPQPLTHHSELRSGCATRCPTGPLRYRTASESACPITPIGDRRAGRKSVAK